MRRNHPFLVRFPLLCALAGALAGMAPLAGASRDDGAPALLAGSGQARIALASGERIVFPLPAGAELTAVAGSGGRWYAAGTRAARGADGRQDRREILVVTERAGRAVPLPSPPLAAASGARVRQEPVPVATARGLAGLAWLEGDDPGHLAVYFAPWQGEGWGEAEAVAGRGPGSQLALAAARLADSSLLLAWSAFDGDDDEVLWAVRSPAGDWSRPLRVAADNEVPDITPALAATGDGGALIAWSRYTDDGYQVMTARLNGAAWSAPRAAAAPGSLFPTLEPAGHSEGGARLLFRTAGPSGWGLAQLDAAGRAVRRATVVDPQRERPRALAGAAGVRFLWEGRPERAAAWEMAR